MTISLDIESLDFQKAFDNWMENWLSNRKQRVGMKGTASDCAPGTSGVSQDSVLGPVLFIVNINDIDVGLNILTSNFADDAKIGISLITDNDSMNLQEDLRKISQWSQNWEMPFNNNKCHILQIGTRNHKFD